MKSTAAFTRSGSADRIVTVFIAQMIDALIELVPGAALVPIQERLLPAGRLQRAGADPQEPNGAILSEILSQQLLDDFEDFPVEAGRGTQGARAGDGVKIAVANLYR